MTAAIVQAALLRLFERMAEAAPVAWRHDPLFRAAAIGAGVTFALLMLRVVGPHDRRIDITPAVMRSLQERHIVAGPDTRTPAPAVTPSTPSAPTVVPSITPSRPLNDATVLPTPSTDHFGTFTPGKHP